MIESYATHTPAHCASLSTQRIGYGRRAFPVAGPTVWNSLPDELRDPACDVDSFKQFFKTTAFTSVTSALEVNNFNLNVNFNVMRSINSRFTYLLTYLPALSWLTVYTAPVTLNPL